MKVVFRIIYRGFEFRIVGDYSSADQYFDLEECYTDYKGRHSEENLVPFFEALPNGEIILEEIEDIASQTVDQLAQERNFHDAR